MKVFVSVCLVVLLSIVALAQAEKPPAPDDLAQAWIEAVVLAAQSEQDALDALKLTDAYKKFEARQKVRQSLQQKRTAGIEAKYPGFTVDWTKRVLVVKPAQTAQK